VDYGVGLHKSVSPPDNVSRIIRQSRRLSRANGGTFHYALSLFPDRKEDALHVIYRFCHLVDDAVDNHYSKDRKRKRLDELYELLIEGGKGEPWEALEWVRKKYSIPLTYFEDLIQGARSDIGDVQFESYSELRDYCYQVAGTVGWMTLQVMGFRTRSAFSYSLSMGRAFQLTNILRDLEEDREMGRRYVPAALLRRHNVMDDWRNKTYSPSLREALGELARRARIYYRQSLPLFSMVEPESRFPLALMNSTYSWYLKKLEQLNFGPQPEKLRLPYRILPTLLWRSWKGARTRPERCLMIS